jgi:hopanoid biosynthesis associated protein HpnK
MGDDLDRGRIRLIVNADDFGISSSANRAILRAHKEGVLTSTSLMVNQQATEEAVRMAWAEPTLAVGFHLTLACGRATLPPTRLPGLVNEKGEFDNDPARAGFRYFTRRRLHPLIKQEMAAQVDKFHATGLRMDHFNGHLHFHLHPTIFDLVQRHSRSWKVEATRLTRERLRANLALAHGRYLYRLSHWFIFGRLSRRASLKLKQRGVKHADYTYGLLQNDRLDEAFLVKLLKRLRPGTFEVFCHPDEDAHRHELEALTSKEVRRIIQDRGIELIRYQDL